METRQDTRRQQDAYNALMGFRNITSIPENDVTMTDPMRATSTQMADLLFPTREKSARARRIFDKISATQQCVGVNIPRSSDCWLCGTPLNHSLEFPDQLAPQCDHILPVIQGIMFLELYAKNMNTDDITPAMEIEYAWAHAICNNLKSNAVFIKVNPDGTYAIDKNGIAVLVNRIKQYIVLPNESTTKDNIEKKLVPVVEYLKKDGTPGIHNLNVLAGVMDIISKSSAGRRKRTKRNKRKRHTRRR